MHKYGYGRLEENTESCGVFISLKGCVMVMFISLNMLKWCVDVVFIRNVLEYAVNMKCLIPIHTALTLFNESFKHRHM